MNLEATYELNGVAVTFRNSARHAIRYRKALEAMPLEDGQVDNDLRSEYRLIAAYAVKLSGVKAKLPDTVEDMTTGYEALIDVVSEEWMHGAAQAMLDLLRPAASAIEKPDSTLTAEEKADPN